MRSASTLVAAALATCLLTAQTRITPPDNKYTPAQDVELGRKAAGEAEQQLPILRDDDVTSYVESIGRRTRQRHPAGVPPCGVPLLLPGRQRARDQRVRPAGRADVRQSRHDRSGAHRRRSRGRDGPRTQPRALRHGTAQASKATKYEIGRLPGAIRRLHYRRRMRARSSPRARSSGSALPSCDSAASSSDRPTSGIAHHGRGRVQTRARWRACSRQSRSRAARAARSG